jgi:hypothetical protein
VLSDTSPDFARLVERLGSKPAQPEASPPQPAPPACAQPAAIQRFEKGAIARATTAKKSTVPEPARTREYRIRIKQTGGPRTCQIVASGVSKQTAVDAALREVGKGWIVLEAVLVA